MRSFKLFVVVSSLAMPLAYVAAAKATHTKTQTKHGAELAPEISLTELDTLVKSKSVTVVDANSNESYATGHIPGAIHYKQYEGKLATVLPADKTALVVAYCGGKMCTAWEDAAKEAKAAGYTNIKHLKVGITGWKTAKLPTETTTTTK